MRIGVLCPSEIAFRRFMPALQKVNEFEFVGVGTCNREDDIDERIIDSDDIKAKRFVKQYGGKIFDGYKSIIQSQEIEAIYIPLPPALHFEWARSALEHGKHVLLEKPATLSAKDSRTLTELSMLKGLALHENYMFIFHDQLKVIDEIISSGTIGDVRLYRISFGFPMRAENDFRYNKALGGGALIDAGGYVIKYAVKLLGESAKIRYAQRNFIQSKEVDMYGSAALTNSSGTTAQIAYGMDNDYKCELEVWGSKGSLTTGRILTAPDGFCPKVCIKQGDSEKIITLPSDDTFQKSIYRFWECINNRKLNKENCRLIVKQAELLDEFYRLSADTDGVESEMAND